MLQEIRNFCYIKPGDNFKILITKYIRKGNFLILNYLPLFHAFGYSEGMMMSLITGAKQIVTETFDPEECLDLVARFDPLDLHRKYQGDFAGFRRGCL